MMWSNHTYQSFKPLMDCVNALEYMMIILLRNEPIPSS